MTEVTSSKNCPRCGGEAECLEYDSDEDFYLMRCDDCEYRFYFVDDTETWK